MRSVVKVGVSDVLVLLVAIAGLAVQPKANAVSPKRQMKMSATVQIVGKPASLNIGWGDGKNVVVPLQVAHVRNLDETDVEANQYINVQVGRLNGVETLVLTVPLNQIALPQTVRVVDLRTGAAVRIYLKLTGKNTYGSAPVQSDGKVEMKSRRLRLNMGRPEERKGGGKIEVSYVPPPSGSYWVMTTKKEFTVIPIKRNK